MSNTKQKWNIRTFAILGVLVAMTLVLSRMLAIQIGGFARITLGSICTILAGLWFGPFYGALCGLASDLLGCLMQGYAPNPLITVGAMCWGIIPGICRRWMKGSRNRRIVILCLSILASALVCTLGFNLAGLVLIQGFHLYAILPSRLAQFAAMTPVYCVIVSLIYLSPVTRYATDTLQ